MVEKTIAKLKMLGAKILKYNSFAIVYELNGNTELLRYVYRNNKVEAITQSDFDKYTLSKYYIYLKKGPFCVGLYTTYTRKTITTSKFVKITAFDLMHNESSRGFHNEAIIVMETTNKRIFVVSYTGRKIDISQYRPGYPYLEIGILYDARTNRYTVGFGNMSYKGLVETSVKEFSYTLLDTDAELMDINYHTDSLG